MVRLLIADDSGLMCDAMRAVLGREDDIFVVGCARTVEEVAFLTSHAHVILLSPTLESESTIGLIREIHSAHPEKKLIVAGIENDAETIIRFVEAGVVGYVLRDESIATLLEKVRAANDGQAVIAPDIGLQLMRRLAHLAQFSLNSAWGPESAIALYELTAREREVLSLIGAGYSNREIADHLVIGWGTVKNHVHSILKKLETSSRHEAAAIYRLHAKHSDVAALAV